MRRRISLLLATVLAGTTFMLLGTAQPASAQQVCPGAGTVTVVPGLLDPVLLSIGDPVTGQPGVGLDHVIDVLIGDQVNVVHGFTVAFATGACLHERTPPNLPTVTLGPRGNGILKGYCGNSSGFGTFEGKPFAYVSVGVMWILTGHVIGVATVIPAPATGSCLHVGTNPPTTTFGLPGGATLFNVVAGAGVGLNCLIPLPVTGILVIVPPTFLLPTPTFGLHIGPHITHIWTMGTCVPAPLNHLS